jgi:MFS family permease
VFLGLTSMFTDISSEMVSAVLPLYLMFGLGFTPLQFGVFDGLYQGIAALVRITGGLFADRYQRYKEIAGVGYALSAGCKVGLLAAGNAWGLTMAFLFLDRLGKGIRTAPRDALISLSSAQVGLAEAFGVHRALDTIGALLGPLVAFSLLGLVSGGFDTVFVSSFCIAIVGLGVLVLFVENQRYAPGLVEAGPAVSVRSAVGLIYVHHFRTLVIIGVALSFVTISDSFVYLTLQYRSNLNVRFFPLLYFGTALVHFLLAIPAGRLADHVGRDRVFLGGHMLLAGVYGVLLLPVLEPVELACCLVLLGAYYAATDGVLMAMASVAVPRSLVASGLTFLTTATVTARFLAALLFGALWTQQGPEWTLIVFVTGLITAIAFSAVVLALRPAPARI